MADIVNHIKFEGVVNHIKFNLLHIKSIVLGKIISSPTFTSGGHKWRVKCYAEPDEEQLTFSLSFLLELVGESENFRATVDFFLLYKCEAPSSKCWETTEAVFGSESTSCAWRQIVTELDLLQMYCDTKSCFVVGCTIKVHADSCADSISNDLCKLLEDREMTDVEFRVEGRIITAHKIVLGAQSRVFRDIFERSVNPIEIKNMSHADFESLLHVLYTGSFPKSDDEKDEIAKTERLLLASDQFGLDNLKLICEVKLGKH